MFTETTIQAESKAEFYHILETQLDHLLMDEPNDIANLSNMSSLLGLFLKDINWVGFYLWYEKENMLILGPFQGKPACIRIPSGKGVCGEAVAGKKTMLVDDVLAFPGHIACDPVSRSEIVIPILDGNHVIGVLDIDSPIPNRFDADDRMGLEKLVNVLKKHTVFSTR